MNSDDITPMRNALDEAGVSYRVRTFGDVVIIDQFSDDVRPWEIGLSSPVEAP